MSMKEERDKQESYEAFLRTKDEKYVKQCKSNRRTATYINPLSNP